MGLRIYDLRFTIYAALFIAAPIALGQVVSGPSSSVTNSIPTFADATGKRIASSGSNLVWTPYTFNIRGITPALEFWDTAGGVDQKRFKWAVTSLSGTAKLKLFLISDDGVTATLIGEFLQGGGLSLNNKTNVISDDGTALTFNGVQLSTLMGAGNGMVKSGTNFHFARSGPYVSGGVAYADTTSTMSFGNLFSWDQINQALSLGGYLRLSGQTNQIADDGTSLTFNGEPISSSAAQAILNFYASNYFAINGKVSKGTFTNELIALQIGNSKLVATASNGALTNADGVFTTRGSTLYKGASGWTALVPSTAGYVLTDGGVGADPAWAQPAAGGLATSGSAYSIIGGSAIATNNWVALSNAYVTAKAATPHGLALAATNRYTILLLPGVYNMGSATFTLDTQFIDILGISPNTGPMVYYATFYSNLGDTVLTSSGTTININEGAGSHDINLANVCLETRTASSTEYCLNTSQSGFGSTFKISNVLFVHNGSANPLRPMPGDKNFNGTWIDVRCWYPRCFGEALFSNISVSGTYIRCKGDTQCFGNCANPGSTIPTLDGTFIECEAGGGFGATATAAASVLSGNFYRNKQYQAGTTLGTIFGGSGATMSGFFSDNVVTASVNSWGGTMSGTMIGNVGGTVTWTTATGTITGCYFATYKPNVAIAATGWTNLFGSSAQVCFDGTAVTMTLKDTSLASIYTNAVAITGANCVTLPPKAAVVLSGTGVAGRATVVN